MHTESNKTDLKNLNQEQLVSYVESLEQPAFRGRQILAWLYRPGITDFSQMTDIANEFREILSKNAYISQFNDPVIEKSRDGSVKFGFSLNDSLVIESVFIPEDDRGTLCVSSQVGCAMGCSFCLTGKMGFKRNLTPSEIVNQVCSVRDWMINEDKGKITNLVFMGMGEPLANLDNLLTALSILTEQRGLDFASRRITVSTCGLVPQMLELGLKTDVNLAVSLHATDDRTRTMLMPVNNTYPIKELIQACKQFNMKKRQRIMFEYTLLKGINDTDKDAAQLAELLSEVPCKINLLAMNETRRSDYQSPARDRVIRFQQILRQKGYTVFIRQSRGDDISAACGQLAGKISEP